MEAWDILRTVWFILIGVLFIGYSILDGFDLGIGALFPFLSKKREDKEALFSAIAPFWDGNEVWLLTGGGALFAAFPHVYATVFSGFYLALMLVLFSLIFRAVSIEFRVHDVKRQGLWEGIFSVGSFLPALLFGVALGNLIKGIPLNENMDYTGNFFMLLRPFPLMIGVFGCTAILLQGSTYIAMKVEGEVQSRARKISRTIWIFYVNFLIMSFILTLLYIPEVISKVLPWIFSGIVIACLVLIKNAIKRIKDTLAFFLSSVSFLGLWGIAGSIHFPHLVRASNNPALGLTIYNTSSSKLTLTVMLIIALVGMPIVIAYTAYLYKVFRGKARTGEPGY